MADDQNRLRAAPFAGQALAVLRDMLLQGRLLPGQRLNEVELAALLGVSRGPIREALQRLATEGLVELVANKGAFVPEFDGQRLHDLYEVRTALESLAAGLAAERASDAQLCSLSTAFEEISDLLSRGEDEHYPDHLDLHARIVVLCGNPELTLHIHMVNQKVRLARALSGYQPQRAKAAHKEHQAILDALLSRQATAAQMAMHEHLQASVESTTALLSSISRASS